MPFNRKKKREVPILKNPARQFIFTQPNPWSAFCVSARIFYEFFTGFLFIANFAKAVSFFGSARETLPEHFYEECEELAARLSRKGFAVITGGSGGIMRAANKGAHRAEGESVGINIDIHQEQRANVFLHHTRRFRYFFSRKTILSCSSELYIFFPGGFGTLDELFEMLTMVQTGHSEQLPIILYGRDFWQPVVTYIESCLLDRYRSIDKEDARLFVIVNSVDEAEHYIESLNITQTRSCKVGSIDL